jgi:hypothetical protein
VVVTPIGGINSGQTAATAMDVITLAADPKSAAKNAFTASDAVNTIINAVSSAQQSSAFQTFVGVVMNFFDLQKGMRQLVTKKQWFAIFNSITIAALYLTRHLQFTMNSIITNLIVLLACNGLILISANRYADWKK